MQKPEPLNNRLLGIIKDNPDGFTVDPDSLDDMSSGIAVAPVKAAEIKVKPQDLNEERAARKMSARNLQTLKKKTIPAAKEAEAKRQKEKKGEYSAAYKKKETDVTVYDKAKAKDKGKNLLLRKLLLLLSK